MTPQPDRVAEELRALSSLEAGWYANVGAKTGQRCCAAMREAADLLTTQAREIAELRGALEEAQGLHAAARDLQHVTVEKLVAAEARAEALQSKLDGAARAAFIAGWWVNAATPGAGGAASREYFDSCAQVDWQEYECSCLSRLQGESETRRLQAQPETGVK